MLHNKHSVIEAFIEALFQGDLSAWLILIAILCIFIYPNIKNKKKE